MFIEFYSKVKQKPLRTPKSNNNLFLSDLRDLPQAMPLALDELRYLKSLFALLNIHF